MDISNRIKILFSEHKEVGKTCIHCGNRQDYFICKEDGCDMVDYENADNNFVNDSNVNAITTSTQLDSTCNASIEITVTKKHENMKEESKLNTDSKISNSSSQSTKMSKERTETASLSSNLCANNTAIKEKKNSRSLIANSSLSFVKMKQPIENAKGSSDSNITDYADSSEEEKEESPHNNSIKKLNSATARKLIPETSTTASKSVAATPATARTSILLVQSTTRVSSPKAPGNICEMSVPKQKEL